jgi:hypothetical protein
MSGFIEDPPSLKKFSGNPPEVYHIVPQKEFDRSLNSIAFPLREEGLLYIPP